MDGEDIIIQNPMKSSQNSTTSTNSFQLIAERAISDQTTICDSESKKLKNSKNQHLKKGNIINSERYRYSGGLKILT